jgi:hypothetical protein
VEWIVDPPRVDSVEWIATLELPREFFLGSSVAANPLILHPSYHREF